MLRNFTNTAPPVTLDTAVDFDDTTLDVGDTTGYPDVPFVVAIEKGTASEEACLVTSKTATAFTVTRGYDGTTGTAHGIGALVEHVATASDYREGHQPSVTEAERDAISGDNLWDGRMVWNNEASRIDVAYPGGGWHPLLPTGAIIPFAGTTAPPGYLLCDGSAISRTTYAALYAIVGDAYGAGDGSTTFNLPDLRQKFMLGKADAGTGAVLGETGGSIDHVHTQPTHTHTGPSHTHSNPNVNSNGSHSHSQNNTGSAGAHTHTGQAQQGENLRINGVDGTDARTTSNGSHQHSNPNVNSNGSHSHSQNNTGSAGTGNTGSGGGENTGSANPPYVTVNYLIRVG